MQPIIGMDSPSFTDEKDYVWTYVDVSLHNEIRKVAIPESTLFADKMNIFVLHDQPRECAEMLCNKHVCKMSIEYGQLLLNAHYVVSRGQCEPNPLKYRPVFVNHPSSIWVADNVCNYLWLLQVTIATWLEYKYRFGKDHKCSQLLEYVAVPPSGIKTWTTQATPPPQCMPEDYRIPQTTPNANRWQNTVRAYREYYIQEKYRFAKWTTRLPPEWYVKGLLAMDLDAITTESAWTRAFRVIPE